MRQTVASALFVFVTLLSLATVACQPVEPLAVDAPAAAGP